jgi:tetratricopeptide (TPR) repeat protein
MTRRKLISFLLALTAFILVVGVTQREHLGGWFGDNRSSSRETAVDRTIRSLEQRLVSDPRSTGIYLELSQAYLQKIRETADASYYSKVDRLMEQATKFEPENPEVFATQAAVANGRHDFRAAQELSAKALSLNPNRAAYYGSLGDAQLELGDYEGARSSYQQMVDRRPDLSSYNRVAHIREIYGDIAGAKQALEMAIQSGSPFPESAAFSLVELGKLQLRDNLGQSEQSFRRALATVEDYPPALEGLARIAVAQGDLKQASEHLTKAYKKLPIAQYASAQGDVFARLGDEKKAGQQFALARAAYAQAEKGGVNTDLEQALFLADHRLGAEQAVKKARAAYEVRPNNLATADTLAWALYYAGEFEEATQLSQAALRLGEHDPGALFHAGLIAEANKNPGEAKRLLTKALRLNPHFSILHGPTAEKALQRAR